MPIQLQHARRSKQATRGSEETARRRFIQLLCGLFASAGIGLLAYRRRSLSRSGIVGAMAAGTTTFGLGGMAWGLSLIFFFVSSSFLSHMRKKEKEHIAADKFSKGSQRDLGQVMANGGVGTAMALGYGLSSSVALQEVFQVGYIGAVATANADTWATELGVLSTHAPRLITTGQKTAPGTSGGVTVMGTTAAAGGALSLGLVFWLLRRSTSPLLPLLALVSGLAGSMFDSILGATIQAIYYCPTCHKETEQRVHSCGTQTRFLRGLRWMNNDVVNFCATLFGSCMAIAAYLPWRSGKIRH